MKMIILTKKINNKTKGGNDIDGRTRRKKRK